ncbi:MULTISPECIES: hypothetical protein [unclassified Clostridium]|uniref:hypothetical protein n=1 Tax=unclassified Clostridium TaxID=2614128 RepID=UPI002079B5CB|nr:MULTISPECIES: hypothetical protein [unclassified Clostridium]
MLRKIFYYPIVFIVFIVITILMPYIALIEYKAISSGGTFKWHWLLRCLLECYEDAADTIGMLVIG